MPAKLDVDREAVRTLAVAVGVREAARQMDIPEATVQSWSARNGWTTAIEQAQARAKPLQPVATKPADALATTLAERKNNTRLHLSKYVQEAAEVAAGSSGNHKLSRSTKDIADIAAKVWPEQGNTSSGGINLAILTDQVAIQYIDQQPGVSE